MDSGCFVSLQRKNLNNNKKIMDSGCLVSLLRKKKILCHMPVISIVECKTSYCNLEWDGFCSLRASTMGLLYAKCKVHLAYRPKNWSTTVRPFGMGCYGFARFVVGTWWVLFCFYYFGFLVPVGFCWAEGSGGVVVIVCLVVAGASGWGRKRRKGREKKNSKKKE